MEAMEEAEDENEEPSKVRCARRIGISGGQQSERILVCNEDNSGQHGLNKRKTDTQWLL